MKQPEDDKTQELPLEADEDFELPAACPLRNNGDDICEGCQ